MIQDIQPQRYDNAYTPRPAKDGDVVFFFRDREILCREEEDGSLSFPKAEEVCCDSLQYLFSIDDRAFYLGKGEADGYRFASMRLLRRCNPQDLCFAGI